MVIGYRLLVIEALFITFYKKTKNIFWIIKNNLYFCSCIC